MEKTARTITLPVARTVISTMRHPMSLGVRIEAFAPEEVVFELDYRADLAQGAPGGPLARAVMFAVADTAMGAAVIAATQALVPTVTNDIRVDFLRDAEPGRGLLVRTACERVESGLAYVRATVAHGEGPLLAQAHATFVVMGGAALDARPAASERQAA